MVNVLDLAARGIGEGGDRIVSASRSSGSKLLATGSSLPQVFPCHRFFSTTGVLPYHRFFLTMGLGIWGRFATQRG